MANHPVILVTGVLGQVGHALLETLPALGTVVPVSRSESQPPLAHQRRIDFSDLDGLAKLIREVRPTVIVNPAAHTAVDKAESEEALSFKLNAEAPAVLATEAKRLGSLLIHYSTDYVFDGSGAQPRGEDAKTGPLGVYGRSKLAGEEAIRAVGGAHVILRTSWVFSDHGNNFVKTMLRLGREREELRVVGDQVGAPTSAAFLAEMTAKVVAQAQRTSAADVTGLYHLTCSGETSWHGFAEEIFRQARARGMQLKVSRVEAIASEAYPTPARRPHNSRLDCRKFARTFDVDLMSWQTALTPVIARLSQ